jgi:hypothetical protein
LAFRERGKPLGFLVKVFGRVPETNGRNGKHAGEQRGQEHRKGGNPRFVLFEKIVKATFHARVALFARRRGCRFMENGILKIQLPKHEAARPRRIVVKA